MTTLEVQSLTIGTTLSNVDLITNVIEAIEKSNDIASNIKETIYEFIRETFKNKLWETLQDLIDLISSEIGSKFIEIKVQLIEIIQSIF